LLAPIGSALTYDDIPNLQRTLIAYPAVTILIAYGFSELWQFCALTRFSFILKTLLVSIIIFNLFFYLHQYYIHQVNHRPWYRQEGYKQLVAQVSKLSPGYKKIVITDAQSAPEIFFLFYTKYDPQKIQNIAKNREWKTQNMNFEKYIFSYECPLHLDEITDSRTLKPIKYLKAEKNALYIDHGSCETPAPYIRTFSEIKTSDGVTVFKLVVPQNSVEITNP